MTNLLVHCDAARWPVAWLPLGWNRWLLVWIALASITVALLVLLRTRWKAVSSWKKCALLSLWLHVLLAVLATSVHLFSGNPGQGPDEPVRVAMLPAELAAPVNPQAEDEQKLADWERPQEPELIAPPELLLPEPAAESPEESPPPAPDEAYEQPPAADESPEPQAADAAPTPQDAAAAPALLPEPAEDSAVDDATSPEPQATDVAAEKSAESQAVASAPQPPDVEPAPQSNPPMAEQDAVAEQPPTSPQPPRPALPLKYAARFSERRAEVVARRGGNAQTEQAVRSALAWLAAAQSPDGRWSASQFGAGRQRGTVLGQDRAGVGAKADMAVTGLALLALLGSGNTHMQGPYAEHVARGLEYLAAHQADNGSLAGDAGVFSRMYCHSMAALAVCESYAVTGDPRLRRAAAGALNYSLAAQHPTDGGWRYWPGIPGDTSQLGWQLMALRSGELARLDVPLVTWTRSERFLRGVTRGSSGGLTCYRADSRPTTSMTAEGLFCRQLLADRQGAQVDEAAYGEAASAVLRELPGAGPVNLYYWYYASLALCREQDRSPAARAAWQRWNAALVRTLLDKQRGDGSWPVETVWGRCGGQVYTTALAALCLEVYYRYVPVETEPELARRPTWHAGPRR